MIYYENIIYNEYMIYYENIIYHENIIYYENIIYNENMIYYWLLQDPQSASSRHLRKMVKGETGM